MITEGLKLQKIKNNLDGKNRGKFDVSLMIEVKIVAYVICCSICVENYVRQLYIKNDQGMET